MVILPSKPRLTTSFSNIRRFCPSVRGDELSEGGSPNRYRGAGHVGAGVVQLSASRIEEFAPTTTTVVMSYGKLSVLEIASRILD
jgi:hypothetical protein